MDPQPIPQPIPVPMAAPTLDTSRPPTPLRAARIIMWVQVGATVLGCLVVLLQVSDILSHGEELSGLGQFEVIEDPIVLVAALIATIFVCSRRQWARPLAVVVEAAAIMNAFINVASGQIIGIAAIGLAIAVLILLYRPETSAWLDGATH